MYPSYTSTLPYGLRHPCAPMSRTTPTLDHPLRPPARTSTLVSSVAPDVRPGTSPTVQNLQNPDEGGTDIQPHMARQVV
ncbi:hypothetical protein ACOMHN_024975 [Nucella lapillus]